MTEPNMPIWEVFIRARAGLAHRHAGSVHAPDAASQHTDTSMRWKIKRFTNDALRQQFVDATVPQGHFLGLSFPDPALRLNEATGHWEYGEIDWAEFKAVLAGNGPCNRQRLRTRREAHAGGAWVREAALAHAAKRRARAAEARQAAE